MSCGSPSRLFSITTKFKNHVFKKVVLNSLSVLFLCFSILTLYSFYKRYSKFRSDYICRVRYRNVLPPVPYAPKMLSIPSLVERHIPYQSTSLVEQTPYSLVMDQSAAIPFDKALVDYLDHMESNPDAGIIIDLDMFMI